MNQEFITYRREKDGEKHGQLLGLLKKKVE